MSTLQILPILLVARDADEAAALRSANGADLDAEASTLWIGRGFFVALAILVAIFLAGCSSLAAAAEGARTAGDIARGACALLQGGAAADATATLAAALREIVERDAAAAAQDEAHRDEVRALVRVVEAAFSAAREASERIGTLAGGARPLPSCPVVVPSAAPLAPVEVP